MTSLACQDNNIVIGSSVCPSVCPSVCLSIIPSCLQTKCNILSLGVDTVTKLGLQVHLWIPNTLLTSPAPGVGRGQNVGLRDFCNILTLLPAGASVFHKHMSCYINILFNLHQTCAGPTLFEVGMLLFTANIYFSYTWYMCRSLQCCYIMPFLLPFTHFNVIKYITVVSIMV